MAEDFAKKGWELAEKQDQQRPATTTPNPFTQTSQKRSYSTFLLPRHHVTTHPTSGTRGLANHTAPEGVSALITGDVSNFPARLRSAREELLEFMEREVYPAERRLMDHQMSRDRWTPHPLVEDMKVGACPSLMILGVWYF
jgi:hypothetical protein